MNYTALRAATISWMNDFSTEFAADVDTMIQLAEARILRDADLRHYRVHSTANMINGDQYLSIPTDTLVVRYLRLRTGEFIEYRPETWISEYNPNGATTGTPKYYSHWNAVSVVLAPTPDSTATVELSYIVKPASIVTESTTWLGTNAEDVLLAACLVEAAIYKQVLDADYTRYETRYKEALQRLVAQEQRNSGDEYRP